MSFLADMRSRHASDPQFIGPKAHVLLIGLTDAATRLRDLLDMQI